MDNAILDGVENVQRVKVNFPDQIIEQIIDDKNLERDANELRNRYNQGEYIQAGDILIFKRLSEAYLRLIWALRRQRKS